MAALTVVDVGSAVASLAAASQAWDRAGDGEARLVVAAAIESATVIGAFERARSAGVFRRGSGGGEARIEPGTVWLQLALARADQLVPCTADKLLNRYVRPLLRALTRVTGVPVNYFGRDWVSGAHRPVALIGFAHDAGTGRCLFEAIVGVHAPPSLERPSFLGKAPASLEEIAKKALAPDGVAMTIRDAYLSLATEHRREAFDRVPAAPCALEPPWEATCEEAIGTIGAGHDAAGRLRIGGELMASRDAIARFEEAIAKGTTDLDRKVDDAFGSRGAVTFGVRSLRSIRDVVASARR